MTGNGLKNLSDISPEEFDKIERLARRRSPGAAANNLVLGVGLGTVLSLVLWFVIFPFDFAPMTLFKLALLTGTIAFCALAFWALVYLAVERPREHARKQLEALKNELLSGDHNSGQGA